MDPQAVLRLRRAAAVVLTAAAASAAFAEPLPPGAPTAPAGSAKQAAAAADAAPEPSAERRRQLVRVVRQDCGSCHGMRLTGGLGPALTPQALADKPVDGLAATIFHGRPGTPMPPWRAMLDERESRWIAERLLAGFPELPSGR